MLPVLQHANALDPRRSESSGEFSIADDTLDEPDERRADERG
jgi:hypothetical protein